MHEQRLLHHRGEVVRCTCVACQDERSCGKCAGPVPAHLHAHHLCAQVLAYARLGVVSRRLYALALRLTLALAQPGPELGQLLPQRLWVARVLPPRREDCGRLLLRRSD